MALTTWTLTTSCLIRDRGGVGLLRMSSGRRIWNGRGLLSKASFQEPGCGGIASLLSLMSFARIPSGTVGYTASSRCIAFAASA